MRKFFLSLFFVSLLGYAAPDYAALVNGEKIPLKEFEQAVSAARQTLTTQDNVDLASDAGKFLLMTVQQSILDDMIDQTLIKQQAAKMKIQITSADITEELERVRKGFPSPAAFEATLAAEQINTEELLAGIRTRLVSEKIKKELSRKVNISDKELDNFIGNNREFFVHYEHRKYAQILAGSQEEAGEILAKLKDNSPENFAALAREHSLDEHAGQSGGDIGILEPGIYDKDTEDILFALQEGELSPVILLPEGYAIFRCMQIIEVPQTDASHTSDEARKYLLRQKETELFERWFTKTRNSAKIEINPEIKIDKNLLPDSTPLPGNIISNESV